MIEVLQTDSSVVFCVKLLQPQAWHETEELKVKTLLVDVWQCRGCVAGKGGRRETTRKLREQVEERKQKAAFSTFFREGWNNIPLLPWLFTEGG